MFVMEEGPVGNGTLPFWTLKKEAGWENPGFAQTEDHPVVGVNWLEAKAFCEWLSKKEGRVYRLPTSAEWSAAAGLRKYPWGDKFPPPAGTGNFADKTYYKVLKQRGGVESRLGDYDDGYVYTSPVGIFAPNWLGLYDMAGNVWQWCEDWHDPENHPGMHAPIRKECRVFRGSGWTMAWPERLACKDVLFTEPNNRIDDRGFRCVLELPDD
jgi:formylglycine-generating enzyme required for sulfatase activity